MSFEAWSKTILLELFSDELTELQREYLNEKQIEQLKL